MCSQLMPGTNRDGGKQISTTRSPEAVGATRVPFAKDALLTLTEKRVDLTVD